MASAPIYVKGDWLAICDVCGRQYKASYLRKRWDGLMVCSNDYEQRHPQDFVRGVKDTQVVPWVRDEVQDTFIFSCNPMTNSAVADFGGADCAMVGVALPPDVSLYVVI